MRLWRLLILPGQALSQMSRHMVLAAAGVMLGLCVWIGPHAYSHSVSWTLDAAHIAAQLNAVAWVCLSNVLLLARDARRLRLPAIERDVLASLSMYVVLGIVLPTLWLGALGGPARVIAVELLLGAGLGMAYAVLPSYLAMLAVFLGTSHWLPLPGSAQPGFMTWAGPLTALLWLMVWLRWRTVLRDGRGAEGIYAPMLLVIRLGLWNLGGGTMGAGRNNLLNRQSRDWMRPAVDLRKSGPGHPQRSLRVALGGWFMPQTLASRLWQWVGQLLAVLLGISLVTWQFMPHHAEEEWVALLTTFCIAGLMWYGAMGSVLMALVGTTQLRIRWGKCNGELPLLALLPGLGDAVQAKRALLRASLLPPLCMQMALLLALMSAGFFTQQGIQDQLLLLLSQLGAMGLTVAFTLGVLGNVRRRDWLLFALSMMSGCILIIINLSIAVPLFHHGGPIVLGNDGAGWLAAGWAAFTVALLWLGRRGWRGLQQRPHPFLPN